MKIRLANKFDIPRLIELMKHYRDSSPLLCLKDSNNEHHVETLLQHIIIGRGVAFVADYEGLVVGMIVAVKNQNIWDPEIHNFNELAYWVEPEHRGSSAGFKLLKKYQEFAEQAKALGTIKYYTISKMINSPDLSYDRFGFRKLEEMWEQ
jgi:GNAT superfamily N-acetyltransferase